MIMDSIAVSIGRIDRVTPASIRLLATQTHSRLNGEWTWEDRLAVESELEEWQRRTYLVNVRQDTTAGNGRPDQ